MRTLRLREVNYPEVIQLEFTPDVSATFYYCSSDFMVSYFNIHKVQSRFGMNVAFLFSLLGNREMFNYLKLLFIFLNKSGRPSSSTVFLNKHLKMITCF